MDKIGFCFQFVNITPKIKCIHQAELKYKASIDFTPSLVKRSAEKHHFALNINKQTNKHCINWMKLRVDIIFRRQSHSILQGLLIASFLKILLGFIFKRKGCFVCKLH